MENVVEDVKREARLQRKFFPGYILVQMELKRPHLDLVKTRRNHRIRRQMPQAPGGERHEIARLPPSLGRALKPQAQGEFRGYNRAGCVDGRFELQRHRRGS